MDYKDLNYYVMWCNQLEAEIQRLKSLHQRIRDILSEETSTSEKPVKSSDIKLFVSEPEPDMSCVNAKTGPLGCKPLTDLAKQSPPVKSNKLSVRRRCTKEFSFASTSSGWIQARGSATSNQIQFNQIPVAERTHFESMKLSQTTEPFQTNQEGLPNYAFKSDKAVRGRKRKLLPGQACTHCEEYYKLTGMENAIKSCSKHRAAHPRPRTPEGFWDLQFPSTQEIRSRQSAFVD